MFTQNITGFKKVSYFCLTLFSTALPLAAPAAESLSRDFVDHPVKGGAVRVPQQPESLLDFLERGIDDLFKGYNTKEDEIQRDLKSPPMDNHRQRYSDLKNKVIDKYEKERPELARFREPTKQEPKASNLLSAAEAFRLKAEELRKAEEAKNRKYQKDEETLVKGIFYGAKAVIDNKVKDPEAKGFFLDLIDDAKEQALELLNR